MIMINKSKTADTRTSDFTKVTKDQLIQSTNQHIDDVKKGMLFFQKLMSYAAIDHDHDKLTNIDQFFADFQTGFTNHEWWDNHKKVNRHHLKDKEGIPDDVNLVDVIEMVVDCVMAGLGRSGKVYDVEIDPDVLMKSFKNTIDLLIKQVVVIDEDKK